MSPPTRFCRRLAFHVLLLASLALPGRALIIFGSPAGHNVDPGTGLPWDNVGSLNGASGVYMGSFATGYWVATANHVGAGNITLAGQTYNYAAGSGQRIETTDLFLFRIETDPGLPTLDRLASTPAIGTALWMIGNGGGKTWGTNTLLNTGFATDPTFPDTDAFALLTDYGNVGTVTGEAQGTGGDSGGATFYVSGGDWILGGIFSAASNPFVPPPATTLTVSVDIGAYYSQIFALTGAASAIPEPGSVTLLAATAALGMAAVLRRRSSRPA